MAIDISRPFHWGFNAFTGWNHPCLTERSEYDGRTCLRIACTQLAPPYTAADQKRIVGEWCEFFRGPSSVEELIVDSRTPVNLFEAICQHRSLKRLRIKWGPVADLTPISRLKNLEAMYLGTSGARDLAPLRQLKNLYYLDLDNFKQVVDFKDLSFVRSLEYLHIEGYPQGPQKIHVANLEFLRPLVKLRALKIGWVIVDHYDVEPLLKLTKLEFLVVPKISSQDRDRVLAALPNLKFGNVRPGEDVETQHS
jgi:Leucine-rich repeat (LRR) protein